MTEKAVSRSTCFATAPVWGALLAVGLAAPVPALAAFNLGGNTDQSFSLEMLGELNDNPLMIPNDESESVGMFVVTPGYSFGWSDGQNRLRIDAALRIQRPDSEDSVFNRDDPTLTLEWERKSENLTYGIDAGFAEASTRLTELEDTGRIFQDGTRQDGSVDGFVSYALDDRTSLGASASWQDVSFDLDNFNDFESTGARVDITHALSPRANLVLFGRTNRVETEETLLRPLPGPATSKLLASGFGIDWDASESFNLEANISQVWVETDDTEAELNGELTMAYQSPLFLWELSAGRSTTPSGVGGFIEADSLQLRLVKSLSSESRIGAQGSYRDISDPRRGTENEVGTGTLYYERNLTPRWSLRTSWSYREQEGGIPVALLDGSPITRGQTLSVGFTYAPQLSVGD